MDSLGDQLPSSLTSSTVAIPSSIADAGFGARYGLASCDKQNRSHCLGSSGSFGETCPNGTIKMRRTAVALSAGRKCTQSLNQTESW